MSFRDCKSSIYCIRCAHVRKSSHVASSKCRSAIAVLDSYYCNGPTKCMDCGRLAYSTHRFKKGKVYVPTKQSNFDVSHLFPEINQYLF